MNNYTIKPLKWEKYTNQQNGTPLYCTTIDIIGFNDQYSISQDEVGWPLSISCPGDDDGKPHKDVKTLEDAKAKVQKIWEKQLGKFLKVVKWFL